MGKSIRDSGGQDARRDGLRKPVKEEVGRRTDAQTQAAKGDIKELHKLNRTLLALSKSSQAMIRWQEDEQAYLDTICKIIVEDCGHQMVWIGYTEDDEAKTVRPVAYSGFEEGYIETLKITWADTEHGRGPTGTAIRTGKVSVCKNMLTDPKFAPWRKEAKKRGYASSIVFPLKDVYKTFGSL
ncbi:MAG: GAF domain-containing protein, partial [Sedimentisphaerales bacterium]|nr:GAF domain-containing protein [Sedimentisphaerales bacterium]